MGVRDVGIGIVQAAFGWKRAHHRRDDRHFIILKESRIAYGRIPKAANSSIKRALGRQISFEPAPGLKFTSDRFWSEGAGPEAELVTAEELARQGCAFCFSFVRDPFDRLVSCYGNKIVQNDSMSGAMIRMGLSKGMAFDRFVEVACNTADDKLDIHMLPQSTILAPAGLVVPDFVGRYERLNDDWRRLSRRLKRNGLPQLGRLPRRNIRRSGKSDTPSFFSDLALRRRVAQRYRSDFDLFYPDHPWAN